jgi:hypothetical protein
MTKIISILLIAFALSISVQASDLDDASATTELVFISTLLTASSADDELEKRENIVAAFEQSEIAGKMTPVLKSMVDHVKSVASLEGMDISDSEALVILEAKTVK